MRWIHTQSLSRLRFHELFFLGTGSDIDCGSLVCLLGCIGTSFAYVVTCSIDCLEISQGVQILVDEEFQGIVHLRTSTLHRKIASARHDFIKLSGSENKLEALLQVLEPSLAKGNRVMVFCNTLNSSRAVDHFLSENQMATVNYHGEVPAEERVQNLNKFKSDDGDCPTLVCTDLAARGLDLDVDHVIMFDFPSNSVDYLHRTGRTARMGAKGKVTSLITKKDVPLATRIEEAIRKNESLESLTMDGVRRDKARARITEQKGKNVRLSKSSSQSSKTKPLGVKSNSSTKVLDSTRSSRRKPSPATASRRVVKVGKTLKFSKIEKPSKTTNSSKTFKSSSGPKKQTGKKRSPTAVPPGGPKLSVAALRGRSSSSNKRETSSFS
ncbi:unnamed protein product [Linum tenue]|uniref:Helicase C-terminal domain-containing protein n=1 Tax=Linum tenue TaxID=586396 RepID=A0AAV0IH94_9ROSI|nr:unnamed protein product [Linum tenue]